MAKDFYRGRKYRSWQKAVFERDEYKCVACKSEENITAHHKCRDSKLRYSVRNGKTLCDFCHQKKEQDIWNKNNPRRRLPGNHLDEVGLHYGGWRG